MREKSHHKKQHLEAEARKTQNGVKAHLFKSGSLIARTALQGIVAAFPEGIKHKSGSCFGAEGCSSGASGAGSPSNLSKSVRALHDQGLWRAEQQ